MAYITISGGHTIGAGHKSPVAKRVLSYLLSCFLLLSLCNKPAPRAEAPPAGRASFYADPSSPFRKQTDPLPPGEWIIGGQTLSWGSAPVYVQPDSLSLDTLYFREAPGRKWDTIICNVRYPNAYTFSVNDCCGGFSVKQRQVSVKFELENPSKKRLMGEYGGAGIFTQHDKEAILNTHCLGMMVPNITTIKLSEIELCADTVAGATQNICFYESTGVEAEEYPSFKRKKVLLKMLYLPLEDETVLVGYDPKTGKHSVRIR